MYEIIDTKRSHRRDQFLAGLPLTLDFENASFVSAIIHATHIAERTHDVSKIIALSHAVVRAASGKYDNRVPLFMSWLDYFTVQHIEMLYIAANPRPMDELLEKAAQDLMSYQRPSALQSEFDVLIWKDLRKQGLVSAKQRQETQPDITYLGKEFLEFIGRT